MENDVLMHINQNKKNILNFVWINHQRYLKNRIKQNNRNIIHLALEYADVEITQEVLEEMDFCLTCQRLNLINYLGLNVILSYYRRRRDNLLPFYTF